MTKVKIIGVTLALFAAFGGSAEAKLYKWVDDKGETHYGEVIPPEYANKDKVQFDEKGREVKKKESAKESAKESEQQASIDQRRKDNALLNTYSNENEIDLARDRNLQQVEARINSIKSMLEHAQQDLDSYQKEAKALEKSGKKISDALQSDITDADNKLAKIKHDLAHAEEKAASVRASYEADKARYRELKGDTKK